jgi:ElaB/YqjD/DUF883 family membrane-anchored ribosome-binding protein
MKGNTMEITTNNAHEETTTDGFGPSEMVQALQITVNDLTAQVTRSRELASQDAERAQERLNELRSAYEERLASTRQRWQENADELNKRIDALLETDQGKAYADIEDMKRRVERAEMRATEWEGLKQQAERDRDHAFASVSDGDKIHPDDPRVAHIWRKAARIATANSFCNEYDKIAEALGIPDVEVEYEGYIEVSYSGTTSVRVTGTASRTDIASGSVEYDINTDTILESIDHYNFNWETDEVDISPVEEEQL